MLAAQMICHSRNMLLLAPNASWYTHGVSTSSPLNPNSKYNLTTASIMWSQLSATYRTNYLDEVDTSKVESLLQDFNKSSNKSEVIINNDSVINNIARSGPLLPLTLEVDGIIFNATNQRERDHNTNTSSMSAAEVSGITINTVPPTLVKPLTLLDHESWENMVHAASLMEVILNQSVPTPSPGDLQSQLNKSQTKPINTVRRKKRFIHAIPIENAKPHHLLSTRDPSPSTLQADKVADAQDFQRLIELQDDEIRDRVALRYLRQYVGPALFNICDFEEAAARHVYLFNSSRLVLAISNFTLERMTVVMTPARTLLTSEARCASAHLECQVSGARVCIDSLSACDGVPNCGSYDIYDEDRLTCGGSAGFQHNVCLAAVTFLAVLLTLLYTVHYWLKRCVPKVSDAFFIYTDAAENVLYLDTIMRSPHDTDDGKDFFRSTVIPDYMVCDDIHINKDPARMFLKRIFNFFGCKRKRTLSRDSHDIIDAYSNMPQDAHRFYSFGEAELNRMGFISDAAVQTGSSLEINAIEAMGIQEDIPSIETVDIVAHYEGKQRSTDQKLSLDSEMVSQKISDELSILKFFRRARSISMQQPPSEGGLIYDRDRRTKEVPHKEEKEIQCHIYDTTDDHVQIAPQGSLITVAAEMVDKKTSHVLKKLRFEEEAKPVQTGNEDDAFEEEPRRSNANVNTKNVRIEEKESNIDAMEEPSASTTRELKSYFWGSSKNKGKKPAKKKTQLSLR